MTHALSPMSMINNSESEMEGVKRFDQTFLGNEQVWRCAPAAEIDKFPRNTVRLWCHSKARYGLPTSEVVNFIRDKIAGRFAIEIGAGHGDLGMCLGIIQTDSKIQLDPVIAEYYRRTGQPPIAYPDRVLKLDALEAVEQFHPDVVVGSWITQWIDPKLPPPPGGGSNFGVKEEEILKHVQHYILVGNLALHGQKKIMDRKPEIIDLPGLRSRATHPELDRIFIWKGDK